MTSGETCNRIVMEMTFRRKGSCWRIKYGRRDLRHIGRTSSMGRGLLEG
jgi:hypothetical protein